MDRHPCCPCARRARRVLRGAFTAALIARIDMLTHLFYLVGVWLAISLVLVLLFGARVRHSDFVTSLIYLGMVIGLGGLVCWLLGIPIQTIYFASIAAVAIGIPFIVIF